MTTIPLSENTSDVTVSDPLSTFGMFVRGVPQSFRRKQGQLSHDQPQKIVLRQYGITIDRARVDSFRDVCQYPGQAGGVPLPYPEIYFTPLMAQAMVSPEFPLSPLGIVHVRQTFRQHQMMKPGDRYDACCELAQMRETEKGIEFDFMMTMEQRGQIYWTGLGTMLSRASVTRKGSRPAVPRDPGPRPPEPSIDVDVPANIGREYAKVSGDYNPHHLWPWTSRLVGFARPIAHGMWTLSRILGIAFAEVDAEASAYAEAAFKLPLYVPGQAVFAAHTLRASHPSTPLNVFRSESVAPYLIGQASERE